jgi:epoxyqueuosine reductase
VSASALAARVKRRARDEGFDFVAVAAAGPLGRDGEALRAWLRRDFQAAMVWMKRDAGKRADPGKLLPGCRSVIALAMTYWPGRERAETPAGRARVALYARGRDYHKVLGKRSRALASWLAEETGSPARAFVDTGPVLERAWSERAGLGWIGKNANLIRRDAGSWLLLAEVLSAAEIEPDPGPHEDRCGTCTACIEACPTDAIVEPGVVDSNRCISNWTIEHRGPIPHERRHGIGDWIFGCDVCQDVCPWNERFAREFEGDPFAFRDDLRGLDPREILALDEAAFRARYSGTSLMRAKWEGMRRNACIVLGNSEDRAAVPSLAAALQDEDPVVREHAAWALRRLGGEE